MNEGTTIPEQSQSGSGKMLRAMVGIGLICALLIVVTYEQTLPRIERLRADALEQAIFKVIPGITKTRKFQRTNDNTFTEVSKPDKTKQIVYAGYTDNDEFKGVAIEAAGQGYADIIRVLYGYNPQTEKIIGFYVLESKETPGLGDKIEKDEGFLENFSALDVSLDNSEIKNRVTTVKHGAKAKAWEVDGITGATISSRAIGALLSESTNDIIPILFKNKNVFELNKNESKK
jgi:Na+-translocating ferredoxin:NAD+ oxidoreductase subunit G